MAAGDISSSGKGIRGGKGGIREGNNSEVGKASGEGRKGNAIVKRKDRGNAELDKGDKGGDRESHIEGTYRASKCTKKTTFERKARSCSQGDYGTKPDPNAKPTVHFTSKASIEEPKAKHTLGFIAKSNWDENVVTQTMAERKPYFNKCVEIFKVIIFLFFILSLNAKYLIC